MSWLLLAVIAAALAYVVYEHRGTFLKAPTMSEQVHTWLVRLIWLALSLAALGFLLRGSASCSCQHRGRGGGARPGQLMQATAEPRRQHARALGT